MAVSTWAMLMVFFADIGLNIALFGGMICGLKWHYMFAIHYEVL